MNSSAVFYILSVEHREHSIQTLDAIDGKQARRTDTQSPLGELFDHGCDSLSTIFVSLSVMITVDSISSEPFYFAGKIKKIIKIEFFEFFFYSFHHTMFPLFLLCSLGLLRDWNFAFWYF